MLKQAEALDKLAIKWQVLKELGNSINLRPDASGVELRDVTVQTLKLLNAALIEAKAGNAEPMRQALDMLLEVAVSSLDLWVTLSPLCAASNAKP